MIGIALAQEIIKAFLKAKLDTHPRFRRRLEKLLAIESSEAGL